MAKILVVDDDDGVRDVVAAALRGANHSVDVLEDGSEAEDWLKLREYDLIILDWQMPGKSGVDLCRDFRARGGGTPVLMLTGKGQIEDKEQGYGVGADDYLTKPFHYRELLLRVQALLKRVPELTRAKQKFESLMLEESSFSVVRSGERIQLTKREWQVLDFLMRRPNQFFDTESLLARVWETDSDVTPEALRTCIKRIRQKIDLAGAPSIINSVKGLGYQFVPPGSEPD